MMPRLWRQFPFTGVRRGGLMSTVAPEKAAYLLEHEMGAGASALAAAGGARGSDEHPANRGNRNPAWMELPRGGSRPRLDRALARRACRPVGTRRRARPRHESAHG